MQQDPDPYRQPPGPYQRPPEPYQQPPESYEQSPEPPERQPRSREQSSRSYQEQRERREDRANILANIVHVATGLIATIFVLHIVFTLFGANEDSGVVSFVYQVAKVLVLGFGDVFTPDDATLGLVLNYGLAAIVYLVLGRLVARALGRR